MAPSLSEDLHYTIKKPGLSIAPRGERGHVFTVRDEICDIC